MGWFGVYNGFLLSVENRKMDDNFVLIRNIGNEKSFWRKMEIWFIKYKSDEKSLNKNKSNKKKELPPY